MNEQEHLERMKRLEEVMRRLDSLSDFTGCKYCGRVVLDGICCREAREDSRQSKLKKKRQQ